MHDPDIGSVGAVSLLVSQRKALLVVDMVESVKTMEQNEAATVLAWDRFVRLARAVIIPRHHGKLIKSLGDGLLVEFDTPNQALATAWDLHVALGDVSKGREGAARIWLRAGIHVADRFETALDVLGHGVNVAVRITALAHAGGTVVSGETRDALVDGWDADFIDLGDCYLKHVSQPVRVYRASRPGEASTEPDPVVVRPDLRPVVAVMPLVSRDLTSEQLAVGALVADGVVAALTRSTELRLVSRMATLTRDPSVSVSLPQLGSLLKADYIVSGSFLQVGHKVLLMVELSACRNGSILWCDRIETHLDDLTVLNSVSCHFIADHVHKVITELAVKQALTSPMPTVESHSLLLAGVQLMHRSSAASFSASRLALEELSSRHPTSPLCSAWQAKWHVLASTRGIHTGNLSEVESALGHTQSALRMEPEHSLALAVEGFVHLHMRKDIEAAALSLGHALTANPNDAFAMIFKGIVDGFSGRSLASLEAAQCALSLTPLHPLRYYFESLAASCAVCAGDYNRAIEWSEQSLRRNRAHASTFRTLIAALVSAGRVDEAQIVARDLMVLQPGFSVAAYRRQLVSATSVIGELVCVALRLAGIPEH